MTSTLISIGTTLDLNTRLFKNCLHGVSDDVAARVVAERTNTMIFVAVHLLDARFFMAEIAGTSFPHPYPQVAATKRLDDIASYPRLEELIGHWGEVSITLARHLETVSDELLSSPSSRRFPVRGGRVLAALSFLVQHESYHIGQLSLLQRIHGLSAMSYADIDS
jgi:uncharacterized damage-inducible protein DinB